MKNFQTIEEKIKFLSIIERKSIKQICVKLIEEKGELAQKVLMHSNASGTQYRNPVTYAQSVNGILEEMIDVLLIVKTIGVNFVDIHPTNKILFSFGDLEDKIIKLDKITTEIVHEAILDSNNLKLIEHLIDFVELYQSLVSYFGITEESQNEMTELKVNKWIKVTGLDV